MPTTIKQALKKWEEATGKKAAEATEVKLIGVYPPIEKVQLLHISFLIFRIQKLRCSVRCGFQQASSVQVGSAQNPMAKAVLDGSCTMVATN